MKENFSKSTEAQKCLSILSIFKPANLQIMLLCDNHAILSDDCLIKDFIFGE